MQEQGRYFVATYGCRVNQADTAEVVNRLENSQLTRTQDQKEADVVVLNTCTVTHRSDTDVRKAVARLQRENPAAKVIVTGCYAQRDPQALVDLKGVSAVLGNAHKSRLPIVVDQLMQAPAQDSLPIVAHSAMDAHAPEDLPVEPVTTVVDRTRPFLKIQDGCDAHCTYCIIPEVRGSARSALPEKVLETVRQLIDQNYFEVVLTGIHLGTYGAALKEFVSLEELVARILEIKELGRLRMSCIEPMAFPVELARMARDDRRLAPHFHLPLQSGNDRVLKRMVRPYKASEFQELLDQVRNYTPEACLGTDVIVGFPGETDEEFQDTLDFVENSGLDYVHVFSYSDRSGTPSTKLGPKVDPRIIKERSGALHRLGDKLWDRYLNKQVGQVLPSIVLEKSAKKPGYARALAENFCNIQMIDPQLAAGSPVEVLIEGREGKTLFGRQAN